MKFNTVVLYLIIAFTAVSCGAPRRNPSLGYTPQGYPVTRVEKVNYVTQAPQPMPSVKIFIDPGHGGKDEGAKSTTGPKCYEKSFNLTTAIHLEKYLRDYGYETVMTRGDDTFVPLRLRSAFANGNRANLFVSVHYNASENPKPEGLEVYYFESGDQREDKSKKLAQLVLARLVSGTRSKGRGVKAGNLAVIREANMPAILVEGGFMSNPAELSRIKDPEYMRQVAQSIAQGVRDYLANEGK
jgi:N-acetylmuramoyl-L-alanine amidase